MEIPKVTKVTNSNAQLLDNLKSQNQTYEKKMDDADFTQKVALQNLQQETESLQTFMQTFNTKSTTLSKDDLMAQFNSNANKLNETLSHLDNKNLAEKVQTWIVNSKSLLNQNGKLTEQNISNSLVQHTEIINESSAIISEMAQKLNLGTLTNTKSLQTSNKSLSLNKSVTYGMQENSGSVTLKSGTTGKPFALNEFNSFFFMIRAALCSSAMVNNAITVSNLYNGMVQDMIKTLQNLAPILASLSQAFKDAQLMAEKINPTNKDMNFGWDTKASTSADKPYADVKTQWGPGPFTLDDLLSGGQINSNTDDDSGTHTGTKNGVYYTYDATNPQFSDWSGIAQLKGGNLALGFATNDLISSIVGSSSVIKDGKTYIMLTKADLNALFTYVGKQAKALLDNDFGVQFADFLSSGTKVDGAVSAVTSAINAGQTKSESVVSQISLQNQNLQTANSNFLSLIANFLSVMMKLLTV